MGVGQLPKHTYYDSIVTHVRLMMLIVFGYCAVEATGENLQGAQDPHGSGMP
jgi:hypothetical protein